MSFFPELLHRTLEIALSVAPWLLLGLLVAGFVKGMVPESMLRKGLGGQGISSVFRATVIGIPLPLCSCGVIPTALALHRGGAGRGPTTAFLIGAPGVGIDSLAITYALLGPFMAIMRPLGAMITAITTGLLVGTVSLNSAPSEKQERSHHDSCDECDSKLPEAIPLLSRLSQGIAYVFTEIIDDIIPWLLIGLFAAGLLSTLVPPYAMAEYGSGLIPMLIMAVAGIPMYICATAATPIAAALLTAGVSPGTVLVFLLAGPVTSFATLLVLGRELGKHALMLYLSGIVIFTVSFGFFTDLIVKITAFDIPAHLGTARELFPFWAEITALLILLFLSIRPIRRLFNRK